MRCSFFRACKHFEVTWKYNVLDIPMKFLSFLVLVGCCTAFLYKALRLLFVVLIYMYKCNVSFTKQGNDQWLTSLYWTSTQHLFRLGAIQGMCDGSHTLAIIISWVERFVELLVYLDLLKCSECNTWDCHSCLCCVIPSFKVPWYVLVSVYRRSPTFPAGVGV